MLGFCLGLACPPMACGATHAHHNTIERMRLFYRYRKPPAATVKPAETSRHSLSNQQRRPALLEYNVMARYMPVLTSFSMTGVTTMTNAASDSMPPLPPSLPPRPPRLLLRPPAHITHQSRSHITDHRCATTEASQNQTKQAGSSWLAGLPLL